MIMLTANNAGRQPIRAPVHPVFNCQIAVHRQTYGQDLEQYSDTLMLIVLQTRLSTVTYAGKVIASTNTDSTLYR